MKKLLIILAALTATFTIVKPAAAELGQSNIGGSVVFGNDGGSTFGVDARFPVSENFSIRPNVYFPNNGNTTIGAAATYDFNLNNYYSKNPLTPYIGAGVSFATGNNTGNNNAAGYATAGADYNLTDNLVLKGNVNIPFDSNNYSTTFGVGAGLRF
jgi:Outer membrane protein beta-barrel domain